MEGHLRQYFPHLAAPTVVSLDGAPTVAEILQAAGVPPELPNAVLCNKLRVETSFVPPDGAELVVLSPLAGG
jgi:hypothetical protein